MSNRLRDPELLRRWAELFYPNTPKPAPETEAGQERQRAYYLALGEFVDTFAHTELLTHFVLRWHTQTSVTMALAGFSGAPIKKAIGYLRRLAEVEIIAK